MIKRFVYIVLLLIMAPVISFATKKPVRGFVFNDYGLCVLMPVNALTDTVSSKTPKRTDQDDKKKIKEIAKARRQAKPEKIVPADAAPAPVKQKPKRQRRPEGLERPPEIPRRNGD